MYKKKIISSKKYYGNNPQSPDFNPIEILWHEFKNYIREKMPRSIEEAVRHAIDFNKNLTAKRCQKYTVLLISFIEA
jgi:hypothetical protein